MLMQTRINKTIKIILCIFLICVVLYGCSYLGYYIVFLNNHIGVQKSRLEADIRSGQHINPDWTVDGTASDTMAAFISYPDDMSDYTFSVYIKRERPYLGYFFRKGGSLMGDHLGIVEYTLDGCNERAFISTNKWQVERLEIDNGNSIQVIDIDSVKPFAIVLPVNAGAITFYDVDGNTVNFVKHLL